MDRNKRVQRKIYKIVLIGDGQVGKTSLRRRYMGKGFTFNIAPTLGTDFAIKKMNNIVVQIWDLAGQNLFANIRKQFYNETHGAILVFDLSNNESFRHLPNWLDEINSHSTHKVPLVIVGNKADLKFGARRPIDPDALDNFLVDLRQSTGLKIPYVETSALTGLNVEKMFKTMFDELGF